MKILVMKIDLRASWVHSLKEKRMVVKSLVKKLQNNFNVSASEIENQDLHQRITIGIASISLDSKQGDAAREKILNFIDENTDAEIIEIEEEISDY
ncbi:DUF503 domain-containing protein [[Clostridium] dakarense]|uniref:DUF503 domain-containing protein n=1 Tax=Faecalimicrobium dakarense TaxID=1301100 RepID=UPI0004B1D53B|nr:DUF503 domain-containing protein [[Clostridium] dakarense]